MRQNSRRLAPHLSVMSRDIVPSRQISGLSRQASSQLRQSPGRCDNLGGHPPLGSGWCDSPAAARAPKAGRSFAESVHCRNVPVESENPLFNATPDRYNRSPHGAVATIWGHLASTSRYKAGAEDLIATVARGSFRG